jgi:hypothetical protein
MALLGVVFVALLGVVFVALLGVVFVVMVVILPGFKTHIVAGTTRYPLITVNYMTTT